MIYYIRNTDGELLGLKYNNQLYYYKKNYQQDIIGIYNSSYEEIVKYKYDSWGNIISITDNNNQEITDVTNIGLINPFRYRSYYYDTETNLYYLNSRYYNPEWGRFINADMIIDVLGYCNLFTYCFNNPILYYDKNGDLSFDFVTKAYEKGKKAAKKAKETVKKTVKKVTKTAKKVTKSIKKACKTVKDSFVFDVGVGLGMDVEAVGTKLGFSFDVGAMYYDGKIVGNTSSNIGASTEVLGASIGISQELTHPEHTNIPECTYNNNPILIYPDVKSCPHLQRDTVFGINVENVTSSKGLTGKRFIGIDFSKHNGVGVHIKFGFEY
jgi:RHS repeat-associated protein